MKVVYFVKGKGKLMLVLTRKIDERIKIGKDIVLIVVDVRGSSVRIGIEAPKELGISRHGPSENPPSLNRKEKWYEN